MVFLDIHLEKIAQKSFNYNVPRLFEDILRKKIPVSVSLPPWMKAYWESAHQGPEILDLVKEIVHRYGSVLGQQGLNHKCKYNHITADPWHENFCIYNRPIPYNEQKEFMLKGRQILEDLLDITPILYVPPNHHFDETTLKVANSIGYNYFANLNILDIKPHKYKNLTIIPQTNLEKNIQGNAFYIHYDKINQYQYNYSSILPNATKITDINPKNVPQYQIDLNNVLKYSKKIERDVKKRIYSTIFS